jgi:hypothetical protein
MAKAKFKSEKARLVAAFDASGKEDQRCLVVAGFISRSSDWQTFHTEWIKRLQEDNLEYFHMVDFAASQDQFAGWRNDEPRRRKLLGDLMGIIKSHAYRKIGCVIENDEFYRLAEPNQKEFSLNAYTLAARTCVADVSNWKKREGLSHVPTGYVFEEGDDGKGMLIKRMQEDGYSLPYFLPKKDRTGPDGDVIGAYTPLQAADLLAYEIAKPYKDVLEGKPQPDRFRWAFEELLTIPGELGYYSPKNLKDLNDRFDELRVRFKSW